MATTRESVLNRICGPMCRVGLLTRRSWSALGRIRSHLSLGAAGRKGMAVCRPLTP